MSSNGLISPRALRQAIPESQAGALQAGALAPVYVPRAPDWIVLGKSLAVRQLRSQIQRIAPYFRIALIRGEAGSGKQLVARHLHALSSHADGPFVVAQAETLAECASRREPMGRTSLAGVASVLESARGGTLYIEGVGELSFGQQAAMFRLLRAIDGRRGPLHASHKNFGRSGTARNDLRILAASERDIRTLCAVGQFRQDLYAHLAGVEIFVPALRQRVEDISELAGWMLRQFAEQTGQGQKLLAESAIAQLQDSPWPANLRGLARAVTHAATLAEGPIIEPRHLMALVESASGNVTAAPAVRLERLQDVVQQHVLEVLTRCGGNKLRAAELLGISRSTLYRMLDSSLKPFR
jgi:DNA-binding NtrC family response regulator